MNPPTKVGKLAVWVEPAEGKPRARLLLVHGIGEHSGRHLNTVAYLNAHGVEVVRFDLRGSGRSEGPRQRIDRFSDYTDDVAQALAWTKKSGANLPLFLLGHSLGGLVALYFASEHQSDFRGLLLSDPAYLAGEGVSPLKIFIGRCLSPIAPWLKIPGTLDVTAISRDPEVVKAYDTDPWNCSFNTVRQGNEILDAMKALPERCKKISIPVWIAHGDADRIVKLEGSRQLLTFFASRDKKLEVLPGVFHEPHNDLDKDKYFAALGRWIDSHLS